MDRTHWSRIEDLFERLERQPPERRAQYLSDAAVEPALRREVEAMLAASSAANGLSVERFVVDEADGAAEPDPRLGTQVGAWILTRVLGRGGMGTVYAADRADGEYRQEVALKLLRSGPYDAYSVDRFRTERQVLAQLVHPNIARLLDGGLSGDGMPYLVMELVDGVSITRWCDDNRLPLEARLRLFRVVCDAVQHAHRALVVHRDLKPSNIFVTRAGAVKLLDFGIAKLLDPGAWQIEPLATRAELRVLTPEYAAPEQRLDDGPVTTATDVYTLGVVLFEILTGQRPASAPEGRFGMQAGAGAPIPPSDAIRHRSPACAEDRRLARRMRGDLDRIVLTALRAEPERRYASAGQLGEEIGRFLDGKAVLAQPDTLRYRMRKFVGRNRLAVSLAAAVILALVAFGASAALQARALAEQSRLARLERDKADEVVSVLVELFEATNPNVRPDGNRIPIGDFLEGAHTRALEQLRGTPEVRARLQQVFGQIEFTRGRLGPAREALDEALTAQRRLLGPDHPDSLESLLALGAALRDEGERTRSRQLLEEALARHRRAYGEVHEKTAEALFALSSLEEDTDLEKAGALRKQALEIRRKVLPANHPELARTLGALAEYHKRRNELDRARALYVEALAIFADPANRRHPKFVAILNDYASLLGDMNAAPEAERTLREALALAKQTVGPETLTVANLENNLGVTLATLGRHAEAERVFREAFEAHLSLVGETHWRTRNLARNVGMVLQLQERDADGVRWMDRAIAMKMPTNPAEDPGLMGIRAQRANMRFRLGHREEAITELAGIVSQLERLKSGDPAYVLACARLLLGRALTEQHRLDRAEPVLVSAVAYFDDLEPDYPKRAEAECELARARILQRRDAESLVTLERCLPIYRRWGQADGRVVAAFERLSNSPRSRRDPS
jgi:serine/threonine protein kinase/Tfp pilus assembly protein PilF